MGSYVDDRGRAPSAAVLVIALVLGGALVALAAPSPTAALDGIKSFRGQQFGAPPDSGMVLAETDGGLKFYRRPGDPLRLGKAKLTDVIYGFYKDAFFVAILKTRGKVNAHALLDYFNDNFGTPAQNNASVPRYAWSGKVNSASYAADPAYAEAKGAIVDNAIDAQHDADMAGQPLSGQP